MKQYDTTVAVLNGDKGIYTHNITIMRTQTGRYIIYNMTCTIISVTFSSHLSSVTGQECMYSYLHN